MAVTCTVSFTSVIRCPRIFVTARSGDRGQWDLQMPDRGEYGRLNTSGSLEDRNLGGGESGASGHDHGEYDCGGKPLCHFRLKTSHFHYEVQSLTLQKMPPTSIKHTWKQMINKSSMEKSDLTKTYSFFLEPQEMSSTLINPLNL